MTHSYQALYLGGALNYNFGFRGDQTGQGSVWGRRSWWQIPEIIYRDKQHCMYFLVLALCAKLLWVKIYALAIGNPSLP